MKQLIAKIVTKSKNAKSLTIKKFLQVHEISSFYYNKKMLKFLSRKHSPEWMSFLFANHDLPSMREMVQNHVKLLNQSEPKYMRTTDTNTLKIVEDILQKNDFLRNNVLNCPGNSTQELASHKIKICDIKNHPQILKAHQQWKNAGKARIIAMGGPSAFDQTLISCLIPEIRNQANINFYCKSYIQSNVWHSANHSHARHGNALNADPLLSGRHLLAKVFKRLLFKTTVQEVLQPNYIKVDVKLNNWRYLKQYIKNQYNGLKQFALWRLGKRNQHDTNRFQSVVSQQIQKVMEKQAGMVFTSDHGKNRQNSHSIHLSFNTNSLEQMADEHDQLKRVKEITWKQVPQKELKELLPRSMGIRAAYRYMGDFSNKLDMYEDEKLKCRQMGAVWQENKVVTKVFLDQDAQGNPFTCGVLFEDGQFVPANKVHLSLGYKVDYQFENSSVRPLTSVNVPATGVSTTLLMRKTPQLKKVIEGQGYLDLAIINSHWTIMAHNQTHVLMRATAGGNTGAQSYMPSYFLNLCSATRHIFGDAFVGVVAAYGCVRAINYKNSTQFAKIADGLVISYGKGGTGNTKRASEAYKALKYLGYGKQLNAFFGKHKEDRVNINKGIDQICQQSKSHNLYYDRSRKTAKVLFSKK